MRNTWSDSWWTCWAASNQWFMVPWETGDCLQTCIFHSHWWRTPWICLVPSWIHTSGLQKWWSHTFNISVEKRAPLLSGLNLLTEVSPCYTFCPVCVIWRPSHQVTLLKLKLAISARACEWPSHSWCFCSWEIHWKMQSFLSSLCRNASATENSCAFSDCKSKWQKCLRRDEKKEWERAT